MYIALNITTHLSRIIEEAAKHCGRYYNVVKFQRNKSLLHQQRK